MRHHWLLTTLIAAFAARNVHGAPEPAKCTPQLLTSVELKIDDKGRMIIPVEVNDTPGQMTLDLANNSTELSQTAVESLKLPFADSNLHFYQIDGKKQPKRTATINSLKIGSVSFGGGLFEVFPSQKESAEQVVGRVTVDLLRNFDFEIDPKHKALRLYSQDHCEDAAVYWTTHYSSAQIYRDPWGSSILIPMTLDGKPIEARLSTAFRGSNLTTDVSQLLFGFDEHSPGNEFKADGLGGKGAYFRAMKLTAQGLDATNVEIRLVEGNALCKPYVTGGPTSGAGFSNCGGISPLTVGTGILEKLRMYFALKEEVLYFSAADAADGAEVPPATSANGASIH